MAVVEWCDRIGVPVFHVPNGGSRNPREAANLKRQGVMAGVPDLCIPLARGGYHGLYVEMKYGKGKATDNQVAWLKQLRKEGYAAFVCYGADNAIECIRSYVNG